MNIEQIEKEMNQMKLTSIEIEQLSIKVNNLAQQIREITAIVAAPKFPPKKPTLTIREVARMAQLHPNTVRKDIENGVLKVVHRGDRKRVLFESAAEYINPK